MAIIGNLKEFNSDVESWTSYSERLDQFYLANDILNHNKQRAIFLSTVGPNVYGLLTDLVAPRKAADVDLDELLALLRQHYEPKPLKIAERFKFHKRDQLESESIGEFIAALRKLAIHCEFGDNLADTLRDRLICGLRTEAIQRRLLSEPDVCLQRALELAQAMELSEKSTKELRKNSKLEINRVKPNTSKYRSRKVDEDPKQACTRCRKFNHLSTECWFKNATCHKCSKQGHIAPACKTVVSNRNLYRNGRQNDNKDKSKFKTNLVENEITDSDESDGSVESSPADNTIYYVRSLSHVDPIKVPVTINGIAYEMELDTGAGVSIIPQNQWKSKFPTAKLNKTEIKLKGYNGKRIPVIGESKVSVMYEGKLYKDLPIVVAKAKGPALLGRNWLQSMSLNWKNIHRVQSTSTPVALKNLLDEFGDLFGPELGTFSGPGANIRLKQGTEPKFFNPRPVPFALKDGIEISLERDVKDGILEPIDYSEWAAPIVPILKPDKSVRVCADFKVTINPNLEVDQYPLPRIEEVFTKLQNGQKFTKLDMARAYNQYKLNETSQSMCVINTHKGLFRYRRLPFGVASAPAIFQKRMDQMLAGCEGTGWFLDDIVITGKDDAEHLANLRKVLNRLRKHGVRLGRAKCNFFLEMIEYLGHVIDQYGIHPMQKKVQCIQNMPIPTNVSELKSFLGMLTYYAKFIPNMSTMTAPLTQLLKKNQEWVWSNECQSAVDKLKSVLSSEKFLAHYDPKLPLLLISFAEGALAQNSLTLRITILWTSALLICPARIIAQKSLQYWPGGTTGQINSLAWPLLNLRTPDIHKEFANRSHSNFR